MKRTIFFIIVFLLVILLTTFFLENKNTVNKNVKTQIIMIDIMDDSEKITKEISVQVNDIINLEEYDGNNIKILEINDNYIKISRDAKRYEILSQTSQYSGETKEYIETVIEDIQYNEFITINIDSKEPFGPEYTQSRYQYSIKFIK